MRSVFIVARYIPSYYMTSSYYFPLTAFSLSLYVYTALEQVVYINAPHRNILININQTVASLLFFFSNQNHSNRHVDRVVRPTNYYSSDRDTNKIISNS